MGSRHSNTLDAIAGSLILTKFGFVLSGVELGGFIPFEFVLDDVHCGGSQLSPLHNDFPQKEIFSRQ